VAKELQGNCLIFTSADSHKNVGFIRNEDIVAMFAYGYEWTIQVKSKIYTITLPVEGPEARFYVEDFAKNGKITISETVVIEHVYYDECQ
jgi:hypothetical protein